MQILKKLIVESPNYDIELIKEEQNLSKEVRHYIQGIQLMFNKKNQNGRIYQEHDVIPEMTRYIAEDLADGRAGGELEHPSTATLSLANMADKLIHLERDGNTYIGKSLILRTPNGLILESLLKDNVKIGRSTRALGSIRESNEGNVVSGFSLVAIDSVSRPSVSNAWVKGILENKEFICNDCGTYEENFDKFEKSIAKFPSKHKDEINQYLFEQVQKLLRSW
jgi:hypothetical protein